MNRFLDVQNYSLQALLAAAKLKGYEHIEK